VNLIPWNDVVGLPYRQPREADLTHFIQTLKRAGVSVTVRQRKGADIDAACGQLRRQTEIALATAPALPGPPGLVGFPTDGEPDPELDPGPG